jgi:protein O-GlcNAc transferase
MDVSLDDVALGKRIPAVAVDGTLFFYLALLLRRPEGWFVFGKAGWSKNELTWTSMSGSGPAENGVESSVTPIGGGPTAEGKVLVLLILCWLPLLPNLFAQGQQPSKREPAAAARSADAAFHAGYAAVSANDLEKARAEFQQVVDLEPRIEEGHSALGAVLLQLNAYPQAIVQLKTALHLKPGDEAAETNLAMAYAKSGQNELAVPVFQKLEHAAHPLPDDVLAVYAQALAATQQSGAAIAKLREAVAASPQDARLHDALGALYAQQKDWQPANDEFENAVRLDPQLPEAHLHLGVALLAERQVDDAVRELTTAVQLAPQNAVAQLSLGKAMVAGGNDESAIPVLEQALTLGGHSDECKYQLALAYQGVGRFKEALPLLEEAARGAPDDASVLTNLALNMVQLGNAKDAIPIFQHALAIAPDAVSTYEDLGVAYLQQSDLNDAIREFQSGLKLNPEDTQLHYNLGLAYKLKDDIPGALPELETAAKLDPNAPDPPLTLGIVYMQQGRFADAIAQLRRALQLRPDNGDGWALLGSVYHQNHQLPEAVEALTEAIRLSPGLPGPHITLAGVLAEQGKQAEASGERKTAANLTRVAVNHQRATFAKNTGNMLMAKGQVADAVARYREAVSSDPDDAEAHRGLSIALARQGLTVEAESERVKAAALEKK